MDDGDDIAAAAAEDALLVVAVVVLFIPPLLGVSLLSDNMRCIALSCAVLRLGLLSKDMALDMVLLYA
jgi:hypothetical protein